MSELQREAERLDAMSARELDAHLLRSGYVPIWCQECGVRLALIQRSRPLWARVRVKPHGASAGSDDVAAEALVQRPEVSA